MTEAVALADEIYLRHHHGEPYADLLQRLSTVTGQEITPSDASGAFGSMASEDWAHDLVLLSHAAPSDLTRGELVEMVARICAAEEPEWLQHWWLRCVEASTGCEGIIDLIYYPEDYFDEAPEVDMTPEQIVDEAIRNTKRRRVLVPPPPKETA